MLAQLPAHLDNAGKVDTLLRLRVADDVSADAYAIGSVTLHVLLSDPATETLAPEQKIEKAPINPFWDHPELFTSPPRKGVEHSIQVRLNGVLLDCAQVEKGWLVFRPDTQLLAVGENLIGILVTGREEKSPPMTVEKVEVRVDYR
jgi:hypothetical protein